MEMSSSTWMKLKLTDVTSPDEIRRNKENIAILDQKVKDMLKQVESKNEERVENFSKMQIKLKLIEDKIPNLNNAIESQKNQFENFKSN